MDKMQAEAYIRKNINSVSIGKIIVAYAVLCCVVAAVCYAINKETACIVVTSVMLSCAVILSVVAFTAPAIARRKKLSYEYLKMVFVVTVTLFLSVLLNLLMYGIYKLTSNFVWWVYMILIVFEIVTLIVAFPIIKHIAECKSEKKGVVRLTKGWAFTSCVFGHCVGEAILYIFQPSDNAIGFILVSLICFSVSIFCILISYQMYRAYLIKKFDV